MKFPGSNTITLTDEAITQLLKASAPTLFGGQARILTLKTESYPTRLQITFTTDPDPEANPLHELPPSPEPLPRAVPPRALQGDDGHPF